MIQYERDDIKRDRMFQLYPDQDTRHLVEGYIDQGKEPGDFLEAVIANKLDDAVSHAVTLSYNLNTVAEILRWFHRYAPVQCWGSSDIYKTWVKRKGWQAWWED